MLVIVFLPLPLTLSLRIFNNILSSHLYNGSMGGKPKCFKFRYIITSTISIKYFFWERREKQHMWRFYLDWLFIFVLPVALLIDPCSRQVAISCSVVTATSVDPASVITPFDDSRICIGGLPGTVTFTAFPLGVTDLLTGSESSKSLTSSFRIFKFKPSN